MPVWRTKYGWRTRVEVNGEKIYGPTFPRKGLAVKWCEEKKAAQRHAPVRTILPTLETLAQGYLDYAETRYTHDTYVEKRACLFRLINQVGNIELSEISPAMILTLLNERAKTISANTHNRDLKNLKAFFSWCRKMHRQAYDPTAPLEPLPHDRASRRLVPVQDIWRVIMVAPMPERAMIGAYWHTGARRGEVLRWTWAEDINFEERWVRLGTHKSRGGSMVYERLWMNDDLYTLLWEVWRKHRQPGSPHVFPKYYQPNQRGQNLAGEQRAQRLLLGYTRPLAVGEKRYPGLCDLAGVEPFGFHDIRHSVAKYLADIHKVGAKGVQQILRHRRLGTTEIYLEGNYTGTRETLSLLVLPESSQKSSQNKNKGASRSG
ncbi:MAG: site-specific integrase [Pseudomonadota bacterium]